MGWRTCFFAAAVLLAAVGVRSNGYAQQVRTEYEVQIDVLSKTDSQPLRGAFVKIKRAGSGDATRGVNDVTDSSGERSKKELIGAGVKLNESGQIVARLAPGDYTIEFSHPTHATYGTQIKVPPPGDEDETRLGLWIKLAQNPRTLERTIWALVVAEESGLPIRDASVEAFREDGVMAHGSSTGRMGVVSLHHTTIILGETMRVRASAEGYAAAEQSFIVGSLQERGSQLADSTSSFPDNDLRQSLISNLNAYGARTTSKSDFVLFRLKKSTAPVARPSLIVQVEGNGAPVADAAVTVETTTGQYVQDARTDSEGLTPPIELAEQTGEAQAQYRVRVSASNFADGLSDIPNELIRPGDPPTYLVQLRPGRPSVAKPAEGWTAAEQAAYDRFVAWAKRRPPKASALGPGFSFIPGAGATVSWDDRRAGVSDSSGYAAMSYLKHSPGDPRPALKALSDPMFSTDRKDEPISLGDGGFFKPARTMARQRVVWYQGWFKCELIYGDEREEIVKLAREVAGVIGNPGR